VIEPPSPGAPFAPEPPRALVSLFWTPHAPRIIAMAIPTAPT
jgi:hypothetical protein